MSADDNAPEQAREVEVLDAVIFEVLDVLDHWDRTGSSERAVQAIRLRERIQAALAPIRAAERQEAARAALIEAAGDIAERIAAVVDPDSWRRDGFDEGWAHAGEKIDGLLRARADGVTGRSGT